jgi:hypothetical protein
VQHCDSPNRRARSWERPRAVVNADQVATLRASGASWRVISQELGIDVGTPCRALQSPSKNPEESGRVSA